MFLDTFAFPFAVYCGPGGGAPFSAWHFSLWRKLRAFCQTGSFTDASGVDELYIQQIDDKICFTGLGRKFPPVYLDGSIADFKRQLQSFLDQLPADWPQKMQRVLVEFRNTENEAFVGNLAMTVASAFGNLIPEQLQRFGNALVNAACWAAHSEDGWHGISSKTIEELTGLFDVSPADPEEKYLGKPLVEQKEPSQAVKDAANLFAAHVREAFAEVAGVERTPEGGVAPKSIQRFVAACKQRPDLYGKALAAIKKLQDLWWKYYPSAHGVLVWPCKRGRWMLRIGNSTLKSLRKNNDGTQDETWSEWFTKHSKVRKLSFFNLWSAPDVGSAANSCTDSAASLREGCVGKGDVVSNPSPSSSST